MAGFSFCIGTIHYCPLRTADARGAPGSETLFLLFPPPLSVLAAFFDYLSPPLLSAKRIYGARLFFFFFLRDPTFSFPFPSAVVLVTLIPRPRFSFLFSSSFFGRMAVDGVFFFWTVSLFFSFLPQRRGGRGLQAMASFLNGGRPPPLFEAAISRLASLVEGDVRRAFFPPFLLFRKQRERGRFFFFFFPFFPRLVYGRPSAFFTASSESRCFPTTPFFIPRGSSTPTTLSSFLFPFSSFPLSELPILPRTCLTRLVDVHRLLLPC